MIAALVLAALPAAPISAERDRFPRAAASYVVAIDGRVVWERQGEVARPPASLTKIMTALLLLEGDFSAEAPITISARAAAETGSRIGLHEGEVLRAGELLRAMLVGSANDACVALAEHAAGSEAAFVARMNARAEALGLTRTHFENACGHDAKGQRSSARDLLKLTEKALLLPEFARIVALPETSVSRARGRRSTLKTSNQLLGAVAGVVGVKTGFTSGAGKCVVVLAQRETTRVLIVLLDSAERWWTAAALVEEAFDAARAPGTR